MTSTTYDEYQAPLLGDTTRTIAGVFCHMADSTGEAYTECMINDNWHIGSVVVVESEKVVAISWAWPLAVTAAYGDLHYTDCHPQAWDEPKKSVTDAVAVALAVAVELGYELADWATDTDSQCDTTTNDQSPPAGAFRASVGHLLIGVDENRLHGSDPDFCPDPDFAEVPYVAWCVFLTNEYGERWVRRLPVSERFNARGPKPTPSERIYRIYDAVAQELIDGQVTRERVNASDLWVSSWPVYGSQCYQNQQHDMAERDRMDDRDW